MPEIMETGFRKTCCLGATLEAFIHCAFGEMTAQFSRENIILIASNNTALLYTRNAGSQADI